VENLFEGLAIHELTFTRPLLLLKF